MGFNVILKILKELFQCWFLIDFFKKKAWIEISFFFLSNSSLPNLGLQGILSNKLSELVHLEELSQF